MAALPPRIGGTARHPHWRPSRAALLVIGAAFALGLLLFLLLWLDQRDNQDFYRAPVAPTSATPAFDPLPAPLPAGEAGSASGLPEAGEEAIAEERPHVVEPPAPPPPPAVAQGPAPTPPAMAPGSNPVPIDMPAPRYPPQALRRGETGTVLVRVDVGPDGVPTSTSIVQSSRSRLLDRAALDAVRRWRFRPAQANGRPTVGSVVVPIDFNLGR